MPSAAQLRSGMWNGFKFGGRIPLQTIATANRATRMVARGKLENRWCRRTGAGARLWIKGCDGSPLPAMGAAGRCAERGAPLIFAA